MNIAEPADKVKAYMATHRLSFPVLLDSDSGVSRLYGVRGTPTRYLISREGRMIAGSIGPKDWASQHARKLIGELLVIGWNPPKG